MGRGWKSPTAAVGEPFPHRRRLEGARADRRRPRLSGPAVRPAQDHEPLAGRLREQRHRRAGRRQSLLLPRRAVSTRGAAVHARTWRVGLCGAPARGPRHPRLLGARQLRLRGRPRPAPAPARKGSRRWGRLHQAGRRLRGPRKPEAHGAAPGDATASDHSRRASASRIRSTGVATASSSTSSSSLRSRSA